MTRTSLKFLLPSLLVLGSTAAFAGWSNHHPDLNDDGKVTVEEIAQSKSECFMRMDINNDGFVTREEIEEFKARLREQHTGTREDRFTLSDTNGDGMVSAEEAEQMIINRVSKMDENEDGEIQRSELRHKFKDLRNKFKDHRGRECGGFGEND